MPRPPQAPTGTPITTAENAARHEGKQTSPSGSTPPTSPASPPESATPSHAPGGVDPSSSTRTPPPTAPRSPPSASASPDAPRPHTGANEPSACPPAPAEASQTSKPRSHPLPQLTQLLRRQRPGEDISERNGNLISLESRINAEHHLTLRQPP